METINYKVYQSNGWSQLVVVYPNGDTQEDTLRQGEISEADVRLIHEIEFEHDDVKFGRVDFFTEAVFYA